MTLALLLGSHEPQFLHLENGSKRVFAAFSSTVALTDGYEVVCLEQR